MIRELLIQDIMEKSLSSGLILFQNGVSLNNGNAKKSLAEVCKKQKLNINELEALLRNVFNPQNKVDIDLNKYPIQQVLYYVTKTHHKYIREKIPAIERLIADINSKNTKNKELNKELERCFKEYSGHVLEHINFEEKTVFPYIQSMINCVRTGCFYINYFEYSKKIRVGDIVKEHDEHRLDMTEIEKLTNNFNVKGEKSLKYIALMYSLKDFNNDMTKHDEIENTILFFQAHIVEQFLSKREKTLAPLN